MTHAMATLYANLITETVPNVGWTQVKREGNGYTVYVHKWVNGRYMCDEYDSLSDIRCAVDYDKIPA